MNTLGFSLKNCFLLLSCEHYTNAIPKEYKYLFQNNKSILESHSGWDIGMPETIAYLEKELGINCFKASASRLIVDLNRSIRHPNLFSPFTKILTKQEKSDILNQYYHPYRDKIEKLVSNKLKQDIPVLHIALHSFTPNLNGDERNADIGILYDPKSPSELLFAKTFKNEMKKSSIDCKIRYNYPYLGIADSFPTYLRRKYGYQYIGIELEINQKFFSRNGKILPSNLDLIQQISHSLKNILL
ncbi:MAG: N-formylglutamate amidohydrolase [Leptospira sp.]|nr:N-formylglutamate amidohydrolase [Leptospira sp.]